MRDRSVSTAPGEVPISFAISRLEKPISLRVQTRRSSRVSSASTCRRKIDRSICSDEALLAAITLSAVVLSSDVSVFSASRLDPSRSQDLATLRSVTHAYPWRCSIGPDRLSRLTIRRPASSKKSVRSD